MPRNRNLRLKILQELFSSVCVTDVRSPGIGKQSPNYNIGGSSTSKAVLYTLFLAMVCFPDAQRKAQEELDRVIGRERLPEPRDEPFLPYISAILKEVQRFVLPPESL